MMFWRPIRSSALPEIERLRTERVVDRIMTAWPEYRGRTFEPIVRSAGERLLPDERLPGAEYVGSYWTRTNDPEVDLIGADKRLAPAKVAFAGSIKWRDTASFDSSDLERLISDGGPGIAEADRARLFGRFVRGTERTADEGSGLGLYVSRELCRAMGGDLVLEPSTGGGGAALSIHLPAGSAEEG